MKSIEEVEKMVKECQQAIEEIKRGESGESGDWKPSEDEEYYYVDLDCMGVTDTYCLNDENDKTRLGNKVIFKTREEAEEYLEYLKVKKKAINEFSKEEWKDNDITKYLYAFCYGGDCIELIICYTVQYHNSPYFRSKEEAQEFINKYEKFIKKEMGI